MSRDFRDDDVRCPHLERDVVRAAHSEARHRSTHHDLVGRHLDVPHGDTLERIVGRERTHLLGESDIRTLATIGAFRVVAVEDLEAADDRPEIARRCLSDDGLIACETLTDVAGSQRIASLTQEGNAVLEACRSPESDGPQQAFYAGVVKPRELEHDALVYRAFKEEQARIEADGGRVTRVVLDYELKRDYQQFLNRDDRQDDATLESDRRAFAEAHDLHVVRGHLGLPDLRIEYETEDGRVNHRDVEIVTDHYSRGQIGGKAQAGFVCYRASGGNARRGGTPFNPRHLTRLA
jgi:hypothetical protein